MAKIQHTGKQYTITLSEELVRLMRWRKGTEIYIAKEPDKDRLYILEIKGKNGK